MTKKEFLYFSLPYELKTNVEKCSDISVIISILEDTVYVIDNDTESQKFKMVYSENINTIKPYLRPLSDLTKEIEHKGEKFVPIVELAKMVFDSPFSDPFCFKSGSCYAARYKEYEFGYNHKEYSFYLFDQELVNFKFLPKQLGLFKKLIEWHFAVGLNSDDYIDLNSLEANPYK